MASTINYRFRSYREYSTITFEGASLPLWELKYEIITQRKMNSKDFDLLFFDAETSEPITDEYGPVPRNSNIIIHRIPLWMSKTGSQLREKRAEPPTQKRFLREPPENYVCFRCGNKGHFIQHCPTNSDKNFDVIKIRKPSGIPKDFLERVEGGIGSNGAVLVTNEGFVRARPQTHVWRKQGAATRGIGEIPSALCCPECSGLLSKPVITNCRHVFCGGCIHVDERCRVCGETVLRVVPEARVAREAASFMEQKRQ